MNCEHKYTLIEFIHSRLKFKNRPLHVELHVSRHLAVWNRVRGLLQLQCLEVHALALVRQDEVRIQRTLGPTSLLSVALARQNITFQTCKNKIKSREIVRLLKRCFWTKNTNHTCMRIFYDYKLNLSKTVPVRNGLYHHF